MRQIAVEPVLGEFLAAEGAAETAALVVIPLDHNFDDAGDCGRGEAHLFGNQSNGCRQAKALGPEMPPLPGKPMLPLGDQCNESFPSKR